MNHLFDNFYGKQSHVLELLALMFRLNSHEYLNKNSNGMKTQEFEVYINDCYAALSKETKKELDCFFHQDSFFGLTLAQLIMENKKLDDIEEFIDFIENLPFEQMMSSFLRSGYASPESMPKFDDCEAVFSFIQSSLLPFNEQAKLLYLYFDEKNTKERFINLIKEINEKLYQPSLKMLTRIHEKSMKKLLAMDEYQIKELLPHNFAQINVKEIKKVILIPSYYYFHASLFSYEGKTDTVISLLGTGILETVDDKSEEEVFDLIKALSDRTKINIIKELNIQPRYGFELAKRLNVSGPTISHHISKLSNLGLITATRKENKIYYEANHAKIESAFAEMSSILTLNGEHPR